MYKRKTNDQATRPCKLGGLKKMFQSRLENLKTLDRLQICGKIIPFCYCAALKSSNRAMAISEGKVMPALSEIMTMNVRDKSEMID